MKSAAYRVHRLIQDLNANPEAAKKFAADPEPVFDRYGLTDAEKTYLRSGKPKDLMDLGVHPNLQMKFFKLRAGPPKGPSPLDYYLKLLEQEG